MEEPKQENETCHSILSGAIHFVLLFVLRTATELCADAAAAYAAGLSHPGYGNNEIPAEKRLWNRREPWLDTPQPACNRRRVMDQRTFLIVDLFNTAGDSNGIATAPQRPTGSNSSTPPSDNGERVGCNRALPWWAALLEGGAVCLACEKGVPLRKQNRQFDRYAEEQRWHGTVPAFPFSTLPRLDGRGIRWRPSTA